MAVYTNLNKKPKKDEKKVSLSIILPIIAVLAVIPLITYRYEYYTHLETFDWYRGLPKTSDFFLHYKTVALIIVSIYMILALIYMVWGEEKKFVWDKKFIPLAIYAVITLVSAIASKNSYFSFNGIYEQFEPVWILMGYAVIAYYCFYILRDEIAVKRTIRWFMAGISVMVALGLSQVFKCDFLRSDLGTRLITPPPHGKLAFNFELGRSYLTLYNPNYVGYYATLIVPLLIALIFTTKKLWHRIGYAFLAASLVLILFSSQSRAGIITIIISLCIMFLCMRKVFIKNWKITAAAITVFIIGFIGINMANQNILFTRMKSMFSTADEVHALKSILTNDDNVTINYNDASLIFKTSLDEAGSDVFELADGSGAAVNYTLSEDNTVYVIQDERFPFTFAPVRAEGFSGFEITIEGKQWYFSNLMKENDTSYYVLGNSMSLFKLTEQEKSISFLENHYHFANMRGYIWARTIPLLKEYFLLGSGPDTFVIAFPNHDLVGLYNSGHENETITKPHCMYLQTAVQTGVPSLIALLVFYIWYLVSSIKLYWKHSYEGYMPKAGVAIFASCIGYMILALTNDSCVTTSPIFYALIGMGLGINYNLKKEQRKNASI